MKNTKKAHDSSHKAVRSCSSWPPAEISMIVSLRRDPRRDLPWVSRSAAKDGIGDEPLAVAPNTPIGRQTVVVTS